MVGAAESIFGGMSRRGAEPSRRRRARWLGFLILMQSFHMYPISDLAHRGWSPWAMAAVLAGEAVLAVLWIRTAWLAMATTAEFRRILPWLAGVAVVAIGMALGLGGQYKGLLIYLSIACAVSVPLRWVFPALAVVTLIEFGAEFRNVPYLAVPPSGRLNEVVNSLCLTFFLGVMMWFFRRTSTLVGELRRARSDLARLAVTEERLRFARDLHDLLGHSLSTVALKSQLARRLVAPGTPAAEQVGDIETVAQQALAEVREAVTGYRRRELAEEVDVARAMLAAAGIEVSVHLDATPLPPELDTLLGWVTREGATNVVRHSRARSCGIRLHRNESGLCLEIDDDGVGPGADPVRGNGLSGLAERVAALGGRLDTGPAPGHGFRVSARLPVARPDHSGRPEAHLQGRAS
ncbi:MAG TPA: sensor histidine kinase [Pseudonocardiaceae bacterium]|jgi:two-component system sensor histidine kinase DesK|nr:sensor histidine kinase [Pseudonocardiaceae bacterium]